MDLGTPPFYRQENSSFENPDTKKVICSVFDLGGFTTFCSQTEPELVIGPFLRDFFDWLFQTITTFGDGFSTPPAIKSSQKFLGDGLMLLWDVDDLESRFGDQASDVVANLILILADTCIAYQREFLKIKQYDGHVPQSLRCGIARGTVIALPHGEFVGSCINVASRLQKHEDNIFCFAEKGISTENARFKDRFVKSKTVLRGLESDFIVMSLILKQ